MSPHIHFPPSYPACPEYPPQSYDNYGAHVPKHSSNTAMKSISKGSPINSTTTQHPNRTMSRRDRPAARRLLDSSWTFTTQHHHTPDITMTLKVFHGHSVATCKNIWLPWQIQISTWNKSCTTNWPSGWLSPSQFVLKSNPIAGGCITQQSFMYCQVSWLLICSQVSLSS